MDLGSLSFASSSRACEATAFASAARTSAAATWDSQLRSREALRFCDLYRLGGFGLRGGYLDRGLGPVLFQLAVFGDVDPRGQIVDHKRHASGDRHTHYVGYVRPL